MVQNSITTETTSNNIVSLEEIVKNYAVIEIAGKQYAVDTNHILEIIKLPELDYPEGMLSCILGMLHFKKEPVGVIDLREVFKKERTIYNLNTKIIIIQTNETKIAIACDKVIDMRKLDKNKIFPLEHQSEAGFFEGVYLFQDENIYIIDVEKIMDYVCTNAQLFKNDENKHYIVDDEKSKEILKSRRTSIINLENAIQPNISLYDSGVSFLINNVKYYINMASVKEFYRVKKSKFIKVPCTKDYIFGLINIKGEYVVVIDIKNLFYNSKTTIKEKSTIIILNSQECKIGVLADEICESMNIDFDEIIQSKLQKNPDNKMTEFVKDDEIYQVLDIEQLLKDERLVSC